MRRYQARVLPDFLLVGTQRGGTTALFSYLASHPLIERPLRKEIHYFDRFYPLGPAWYRAHFPLHEEGREWITGEATADYLFVENAPLRAHRMVPSAKIIVVLRNPVDRAYSAWTLMTRQGRENRSFEDAVRSELSGRPRSQAPVPLMRVPKAYLARGNYPVQLKRWTERYGSEGLLVLMSDHLLDAPLATYRRVLEFLDLPMFEDLAFEVRHETHASLMDPKLRHCLSDYFGQSRQELTEMLGSEPPW